MLFLFFAFYLLYALYLLYSLEIKCIVFFYTDKILQILTFSFLFLESFQIVQHNKKSKKFHSSLDIYIDTYIGMSL